MNEHTPDCTGQGTYAAYSSLTLAFLAGGITGAAVALLLAPQSGKATREMMGRKLDDTADSAQELKNRMVGRLSDAVDSARDLKDRTMRQGKEFRDEAAHRVEGAASALAGHK